MLQSSAEQAEYRIHLGHTSFRLRKIILLDVEFPSDWHYHDHIKHVYSIHHHLAVILILCCLSSSGSVSNRFPREFWVQVLLRRQPFLAS